MSPARRKLAITLTTILATAIVLLTAVILIPAWQARYHSSRLLTRLADLHPSITSEAQARAPLKPFSRFEESSAGRDGDKQFQEVSYTFYNTSNAAEGIFKP